MTTELFSYSGPVTLTGPFGKVVKIAHANFATVVHVVDRIEDSCCGQVDHAVQYEWIGTARVPGLVYGLVDVLGGSVLVTLPDGRTGKAYATGTSEESVWIIELQGVGTPPE